MCKGTLPEGLVYVGRTPGPGGKRSKWANPFRIGPQGSREEVVEKYCRLAAPRFSEVDLKELGGKVLLCHCGERELCHAEVLCEYANIFAKKLKWDEDPSLTHVRGTRAEEDPMMEFIDDRLPTRAPRENGEEDHVHLRPVKRYRTGKGCGLWGTHGPPAQGNLHGQRPPF